MKIFVCVKQVPDTETKVRPNSDGTFIETDSIKWILSPYDSFAVEQALLVKEKISGSTVTVVRVGGTKDTEALRTAMAMGADDGILVDAPDNLDAFTTAHALAKAIEKTGEKPDLIFTGKQAIDSDNLQVPQLMAEVLGLPSVSVIVGFEMDGNTIKAKREIEGGALEVYNVDTPALFTCNKALNNPRYTSLPGILKAKKKPMAKYSLGDLGISESDQRVIYSNYRLPPEKPPGKKFDAMEEGSRGKVVQEVVQLLRSEAKVI